jgi:chitodextrinase
VAASTSYAYRVQAIDAAGNRSAQSSEARAKTGAAADKEPPTAPTGLQATAVSTSEIDLSWAASSDNVAVTEYVVYRNGAEIARVSGATTTYRDPKLTESTTYTYTVKALDGAGNISGTSASATATTQSAVIK